MKIKLFGILFLAAFACLLPASAIAQGRYANVYNRNQVRVFVQQLERSSRTFQTDFDAQMDRGRRDGTIREDQYNSVVRNYSTSVTNFKRQFDRNSNWWQARNAATEMVSAAQSVNAMMTQSAFARPLERQWRQMRGDINKVADTWDLPGLEGGGWSGGGNMGGGNTGGGNWNGSGAMSAPPTWARGSFNWIGSDQRQMIIDRSGRVTLYALGRTTYGTYNRNSVFINGENLQITRISNGVRLYNPNGGGTSDWVTGNQY